MNQEQLSIWQGKMPKRIPIIKLLEDILSINILYEHKIIKSKLAKYSKNLKKKSKREYMISEGLDTFNNSFNAIEIIRQMAKYGIDEFTAMHTLKTLEADRIIIPYSPRAKAFIRHFKHTLEILMDEEIEILKTIDTGIIENAKLKEITEFPILLPILHALRQQKFIDNDNNLTEIGLDLLAGLYLTEE